MINIHPIVQEDINIALKEAKSDLTKLSGKNVLITGASGMLARYLVYTILKANEKLLKQPAHLYLVIRSQKEPFGKDKNITYLHLDIAKRSPGVKNIHYIIHAASKSAPKMFTKEMIDTLNTNIRGAYHLLDITDNNLNGFLYLSSGAVYGEHVRDKEIDEAYIGTVNHIGSKSAYTMGKRATESILINYFRERKLPIIIARIFHTFGPGLNLSDGRVFSDFIQASLSTQTIQIKGDSQIKRPYLYIRDATIMFFKLLLSAKKGEIYNVANDQEVHSISEFAAIVSGVFSRQTGLKTKVTKKRDTKRNYYNNTAKIYRPTINKFRNDFNWQPQVTTEEAVERTVVSLLESQS